MPLTPYTLNQISRRVCTMLLPASQIERMRLISLRTGIPSNTLAALALDEYLFRHYPEGMRGAVLTSATQIGRSQMEADSEAVVKDSET